MSRPFESTGQYEPVSEEEAAELGQALLARLRGESLTPSQQALVLRAAAESPEYARSPEPVEDVSISLLTLSRGQEAEVRFTLRSYRGSSLFLDIRRWERKGRNMRPTRRGVTIRAKEIGRVMESMVQAARRMGTRESSEP